MFPMSPGEPGVTETGDSQFATSKKRLIISKKAIYKKVAGLSEEARSAS